MWHRWPSTAPQILRVRKRPTLKEGDLEQIEVGTDPRHFVGLDVHRRYATVAAVDSKQQVVLTARRIDFNDFDEWVRKHLRRTEW